MTYRGDQVYTRVDKFADLQLKDLDKLVSLTREEDSWMNDLLNHWLPEERTADLLVARRWMHFGDYLDDCPPVGWATAHVTLLKSHLDEQPRPFVELSVFVDPRYRRQGHAAFLCSELRALRTFKYPFVAFPADYAGVLFYESLCIITITEEDIDEGRWIELTPLLAYADASDDLST